LLLDLLDLYHHLVDLLDLYHHLVGLLGQSHLLVNLLDLLDQFHLLLDLLDLLVDKVGSIEYRSLYRADKGLLENTVCWAHMDYNMDYTTYLITPMFL
jgi:hypothetical protein